MSKKDSKFKKWFFIGVFLLTAVLLIGFMAFKISPWPESLLIRYLFEKSGSNTSGKLLKYVPSGIETIENLQYIPNNKNAYLDVYFPQNINSNEKLPTIVWIHGGAFIAGDKSEIANYLKILAGNGYTVVGVNYTLAPEAKYPTPIKEANAALSYLDKNSDKLHINKNKIVLAGDSADAQIAASLATLITNPKYAKELDIKPAISKDNLKAVLLNCGLYNLADINFNGAMGGALKTVVWAYFGNKEIENNNFRKTFSVINFVSKDFPPTYITVGNSDPLEPQSKEMALRLEKLGVPVETLFYKKDHKPGLGHEYQFDLETIEGKKALETSLDFVERNAR